MIYDKYMYLYPPRPVQTTKHTELNKYDDGQYIGQPKYNGDCSLAFINESQQILMNRHKEKLKGDYSDIDFRGMYDEICGKGWLVLCGEFLYKSKLGEDGKLFNKKWIIWDILVYRSNYMLGSTTEERLLMLERLLPSKRMSVSADGFLNYNHVCTTFFKGIYKSPSYEGNFSDLYDDLVKTDVYEGLVLKRKNAKLTLGLNEINNNSWQIKCRKPTKNYSF